MSRCRIARSVERPINTGQTTGLWSCTVKTFAAFLCSYHDYAVSKNTTDDEIGPCTVTLSAAKVCRAGGHEMLRCAQHDSAVTHMDAWINVFMCLSTTGVLCSLILPCWYTLCYSANSSYPSSLGVYAIVPLFRVWRKEESERDEILLRNHSGNYRNTLRRSIHATVSADGKDIPPFVGKRQRIVPKMARTAVITPSPSPTNSVPSARVGRIPFPPACACQRRLPVCISNATSPLMKLLM